jgi:serine/threonine-protein phosphatase 2A regulatory subunit B
MEARPLKVIPVHEFLRPKLVELYESDCIFDKFEVSTSGSSRAASLNGGGGSIGGVGGGSVMTGSYSNCFKIYDLSLGSETTIELAKGKPKPPAVRPIIGGSGLPVYDPSTQTAFFSSSSSSSSSSDDVNEVQMADSSSFSASGTAAGHQPSQQHRIPIAYDHSLPPIDPDEVDFGKKVLHFSWHPNEDIVAVAGLNNLYIYHI